MSQAVSIRNTDTLSIKATLLIASLFTVMAAATIAPALPAMQVHFADVENVEVLVRLVLTLPALFIVIGAPIAGYLIDKLGRKSLLMMAMAVYGVAGTSAFVLNDLSLILIGRAFLGLSVAGIMTCVNTLISDYYDGKTRAQILGLQAAFAGMGGTIFVSLSGALAESNWRTPFLIYLLAFFVLPLVMTVLYEPQKSAPAPATDDNIPARVPTPIGLMIFAYACFFFSQIVFYIIPTQLPFYLNTLTGATSSQSGLAIAWMSICYAFSSSQAGRFGAKFEHLTLVISAFIITSIGYMLVALAQNWVLIIIGLPISGFGLGLLIPMLNVWLAEKTPLAIRGRVFSGVTTSFFLGQFLSPIVAQPIINITSISTGFFINALVLGMVGVLFIFIKPMVIRFSEWVR